MPTAKDDERAAREFEDLVELLSAEDPEVKAGKMFGMPVFMRGRKAFGGPRQGAMVFKLSGDAHAKALALKGAHLFDPGDMGRPMKQWVVVPIAHRKVYEELARAAAADLRAG
ncbi:MAG: hypothetical protein ACJ71T_12915 [Actinomycetales bacterium]|jgi:hypothetical protein